MGKSNNFSNFRTNSLMIYILNEKSLLRAWEGTRDTWLLYQTAYVKMITGHFHNPNHNQGSKP